MKPIKNPVASIMLLLFFITASPTLYAQTEVAVNTFMYGHLNGTLRGHKIIVHCVHMSLRARAYLWSELKAERCDIIPFNTMYPPMNVYSRSERIKMAIDSGVDYLIGLRITHIDSITYNYSNTTAGISSLGNYYNNSYAKGRGSTISGTTKRYTGYQLTMYLCTYKDSCKKPFAVLVGDQHSGYQSPLTMGERIINRMIAGLRKQKAFKRKW